MELKPSCPHCGCALNFFDNYNRYADGNRTLIFARGNCPQCHRNYRWTEVYVLHHHIEDLEEDE